MSLHILNGCIKNAESFQSFKSPFDDALRWKADFCLSTYYQLKIHFSDKRLQPEKYVLSVQKEPFYICHISF